MRDPYRNAEHDVQDALGYYDEVVKGGYTPMAMRRSTCFAVSRGELPLRKILAYDDYTAWGGFAPGELVGLRRDALEDTLWSYRNDLAPLAFDWLRDGSIPAVVLVESSHGRAVGDGRGRVSLAVGLNLPSLPVIVLRATRKPLGPGVVCW